MKLKNLLPHTNFTVSLIFLLFTTLHLVKCAVLGIDFGQEFTKASLVAPGAPFEILMTADSKRKDVSGITFKKLPGLASNSLSPFERVYGNSATAFVQRFPETSPFYLKPLLGQPLDSPAAKWYSKQFPAVTLVPSKNNRSTVAVELFGEIYSIEELIAMSFGDIKSRAAKLLAHVTGGSSGSGYIKDTALTVPPHYTVQQRRALVDVVDISGLKLISLVNDGVAVAVNLVSNRQQPFDYENKEYHIIYDVGAGSTSATLVALYQADLIPEGSFGTIPKPTTVIDVIGVGYDGEFGGHLLTARVRDILIDKFVKQSPTNVNEVELLKDSRAMARFWREAERVKSVLSANSDTHASIESAYKDISLRTHVNRAEFEKASSDLFNRVIKPIHEALNPLDDNSPSIDFSKISSIILTGGSTRVPFIQQRLQTLIDDSTRGISSNITLAKNVNADEAAVLGTTLRGVGISKIFKSKDIAVIDRALWDYHLSTGDKKATLFPKGTPLDTRVVIPLSEKEINDDGFSLSISENGLEFIRHDISNVNSTIQKLINDSTRDCIGDVSFEAEFHLTNSRLVDVIGVYAHCNSTEKDKPKKSTSSSTVSAAASSETSIVSEQSEAVSQNTETKTTATIADETAIPARKPVKINKKYFTFKPKYEGSRPMGTASKQSAISRLRTLERFDTDRLAKEEARNDLESRLYRVRDILHSEESAQPVLASISEWFDYESESATIKELQEKLTQLNELADSYDKDKTADHEKTQQPPTEPLTSEDSKDNTEDSDISGLYDSIRNIYGMLQDLGIEVPVEDEAVQQFLGDSDSNSGSNLQGIAELLRSGLEEVDNNDGAPFDSQTLDSRLKILRDMIKGAGNSRTESTDQSSSSKSVPVHDDL